MNHTKHRLIAIAVVALLVGVAYCVDAPAAQLLGFHVFDPSALSSLALVGVMGDIAVDPEAIKAELKKISDAVKEEGAKALKEAEKAGKLSEDTKKIVDELLSKQGDLLQKQTALEAQVLDVAQKSIKGTGAQPPEQKSIGQQVVESEEFVAFIKGGTRGKFSLSIPVKTIATVSSLTTGTGGVGAMVRPDRIENPLMAPALRRLTIRNLMAPGRTNSNMIEYVKETGYQNMAGIVAEGATKPQSDIAMTLVQSAVATLAHWLRATKIILDDAPQLQSYIDTRLRYGLALVEEAQLLNGSGSGGNLNGLYTQATAYAAPITIASPTSIDLVRLAMLQVEVAEYPATGIVMNPVDWAWIELMKDTLGRYIIGQPQGDVPPRLWNRDVVPTNSMPIDSFLVGAFSMGSQIFDKEDANVLISTEDQDNFVKNLITIRAEERLAMAVYRPEAFVKGDFGRV